MVDDLVKALEAADFSRMIYQRRQLHMHPEVGFELPFTISLIKEELERIGIPYTERYGKSSVVATLGNPNADFTIGFRADMDALPIQDKKTVPYHSCVPGRAHACGHDAHTAMLLAVARGLYSIQDSLKYRVKLLFQPNEESFDSGARYMVQDGVMDDIDIIVAAHVESALESGQVGFYEGLSLAASRPTLIRFFGMESFDGFPQEGIDALAMAVNTYNDIQMMLVRELNPLDRFSCSISALNAGCTNNIIPAYAEMKLSIRAFNLDTDAYIFRRIKEIAQKNAALVGGSVEIDGQLKALPMLCDHEVTERVRRAARQVVGSENMFELPQKMNSEDFSYFLEQKPGTFFLIGTRNTDKGITATEYSSRFDVDEDALMDGVEILMRLALEDTGEPSAEFMEK
ncbi:M20 metallopeptidase family protein [Hominifimenecus sp. rT4P-3]|uniref:M20 metallopeptidase family protein n=1 Tax=Hominifimenecus sp. rT4P-3 TaxID=3242979 RepID=UPI003DA6CCB1